MFVSSLLHGIILHHGSLNGNYIGFGLKALASLEGYCARFCKNIDVVELHKQLDSIFKNRNEGKYNSTKQDKVTKLTFVFLGWHFRTTSSKKMVKEGKLDNGGASWNKLGLYLHLIGDEIFNLGYKKVGFYPSSSFT
jgi:hypothetical protein